MNPYEKAIHDPNQYVVQTHFERKDLGQGSMFRVQPWRRGYGPSRSRSVEASMDRVTDTQRGWGIATAHAAGTPIQALAAGEDTVRRKRGLARANTLDTLKRSTLPTEHLQGLTIDIGGPVGVKGRTGSYKSSEGRAAVERSHFPPPPPSGQSWSSKPGPPEDTLIHEIGHHVEYESSSYDSPMGERDRRAMHSAVGSPPFTMATHEFVDRTRHIDDSQFSIPFGVDVGTREGFADSYATHHLGARADNYDKQSLNQNVLRRRNGSGYGSDPSGFGLTLPADKKAAIGAYEHERHRWGQQASWEGATARVDAWEEANSRGEPQATPISQEQFGQIPGQQRLDLK